MIIIIFGPVCAILRLIRLVRVFWINSMIFNGKFLRMQPPPYRVYHHGRGALVYMVDFSLRALIIGDVHVPPGWLEGTMVEDTYPVRIICMPMNCCRSITLSVRWEGNSDYLGPDFPMGLYHGSLIIGINEWLGYPRVSSSWKGEDEDDVSGFDRMRKILRFGNGILWKRGIAGFDFLVNRRWNQFQNLD